MKRLLAYVLSLTGFFLVFYLLLYRFVDLKSHDFWFVVVFSVFIAFAMCIYREIVNYFQGD